VRTGLQPRRQQKAELTNWWNATRAFERPRPAATPPEQHAQATEDWPMLAARPPSAANRGFDISHIQGSDAVRPQWFC